MKHSCLHSAHIAKVIVLIVSLFSDIVCAQEDPYEYGEFFLPDPAFVKSQCEEMISGGKAVSSVRNACEAYRGGEIDGDQWLLRLSPVLRPTPRCPPGMLCRLIEVPPLRPIPKGYKTYSLALVPSTGYERSEVERIREAFFAFGEAIGPARGAIWFEPNQTVKFEYSQRTTERPIVDINRSKQYCDQFALNYNDGPFIVTSDRRPDTVIKGDEKIVIRLGGISGDRVVRVLNVLEQDLRTERDIRKRALLFEEVKQRVLSAVDRHGEVLKEVTLQLLK